jgi:phenylalanyl-tRNA synthetase beta chain
MIDWASQRTAQLITQVAGGKVAKGVVDVYPAKWEAKTVQMRFSRLNKLLGIEVGKDEAVKILTGLGFEPKLKDKHTVKCTTPTWRHDIYREVDLIEEVARSHGYNKIPVDRKIYIEVAPVDKRAKAASELRTFLNGCGFYETINITFVDRDVAELFTEKGQGEHLKVKDESGRSANLLRQSLLGSLLGVLKSNYNAKNIPCRIFELANTFQPARSRSKGDLPVEGTKLGLVFDVDFRGLRGVIEGLIRVLNKNANIDLKPVKLCWAEAGAEVVADGQKVGACGIISGKVAEKFDLTEVEVCAAQLDFEALLSISGGARMAKPIPRFPAITRDLSLIIDEDVSWVRITEAINRKAPAELEDIQFVGVFRGKPIEAGKKSVTVSLRFRDEDGTLRHEVVDDFEKQILSELTAALGAQLRTA